MPVKLDEWEIDAAFSCSQKGLSCPPGLSPVSFSPRAVEALKKRKTKVQSWYLDLPRSRATGAATGRTTTPRRSRWSTPSARGCGWCWRRGWRPGSRGTCGTTSHSRPGLTALGLKYIAAEGTSCRNSTPCDSRTAWTTSRAASGCSTEFGIEVGGGLGEFKGKAWRIGLMGYNSRPNCVFQVLAALEQVLAGAGVKVERGRGRRGGRTGLRGIVTTPRGNGSIGCDLVCRSVLFQHTFICRFLGNLGESGGRKMRSPISFFVGFPYLQCS